MSLAGQSCVACDANAEPLGEQAVRSHLKTLGGWSLHESGKAIEAQWNFKNFKQALEFVQRVAAVAEAENHHPDICFGWGYVRIALSTHAIDGLHQNDFIVAAKIDELAT